MGGKRELRRCMSLMDDTQHASDELLSRAQTIRNHVNTFCPISIQIDGCSDDEEDETDKSCIRELETLHMTSMVNPADHNVSPTRTSPIQKSYTPQKRPPLICHRSSPNFLEVPDNSDLSLLKATAVRLNLRTRSSSFLEWQSKWLDKPRAPPEFPVPVEGGEEGGPEKLTEERKERINEALGWLKTELKEMQSMDQHLARQLLSLRHDIHQLRLNRSCQQHQDLLDDVQSELEEQEELSVVLDLPNCTLSDTPLKQIGVTRMNISARRFSTC